MAKRMKRMPPEMEMTHGWSVCGTNKRVFHDEDLNGEENAAGDGDDAWMERLWNKQESLS